MVNVSNIYFKDEQERNPIRQSPSSKRPDGMPALDLQSSQDDEHAFRVRLKNIMKIIFCSIFSYRYILTLCL